MPKGNERPLEERKGKTPSTTIYEKASHETKPLQGRSIATRKPQGNDFSRLCKQNECESITMLQRYPSKLQLAADRERPILAIQPQPEKRIALRPEIEQAEEDANCMQTVNDYARPQRKSDHVPYQKTGPRNGAGSELPVAKFLSLVNAADFVRTPRARESRQGLTEDYDQTRRVENRDEKRRKAGNTAKPRGHRRSGRPA